MPVQTWDAPLPTYNRPPDIHPTSTSHSNPEHPLTSTPVLTSSPEDLRPVAVVNPLDLNQTTSDHQMIRAATITQVNSLIVDRPGELHKDTNYAQHKRRGCLNDPGHAEFLRNRRKERQRKHNKMISLKRLNERQSLSRKAKNLYETLQQLVKTVLRQGRNCYKMSWSYTAI